jgi:hypothetical protein
MLKSFFGFRPSSQGREWKFNCVFGHNKELTKKEGVTFSHSGYYIHTAILPTVSITVIFI